MCSSRISNQRSWLMKYKYEYTVYLACVTVTPLPVEIPSWSKPAVSRVYRKLSTSRLRIPSACVHYSHDCDVTSGWSAKLENSVRVTRLSKGFRSNQIRFTSLSIRIFGWPLLALGLSVGHLKMPSFSGRVCLSVCLSVCLCVCNHFFVRAVMPKLTVWFGWNFAPRMVIGWTCARLKFIPVPLPVPEKMAEIGQQI